MTREDRAREAEEYYDAVTIKGWEYCSRSTEVLEAKDALTAIDAVINKYAREGWRLHTIQFGISAPFVYVVFERRRDYDREGVG